MKIVTLIVAALVIASAAVADVYYYGMSAQDAGILTEDIKSDVAITNNLVSIRTAGTNVNIRFNGTLSGAAKTALDAVIVAHPDNIPEFTPHVAYSVPMALHSSDDANPITVYSGFWETFEFPDTAQKKAWLTTRRPDNMDNVRPLCLFFSWKVNTTGSNSGLVWVVKCRYIDPAVENSNKAADETFTFTNTVVNVQHRTAVIEVPLTATLIQPSDLMSFELRRTVADGADDWTGAAGVAKNAMLIYYQELP